VSGAPAASGGGRGGLCSGEGWLERRDTAAGLGSGEAREGRGEFRWLAVGRELELTAAGLDGAGGSSGADGAAWCAGGEGQRCLYRGRADLLATIGLAGDAPGDARAGRQGRDCRSIAGWTAARGSKRSRCPRPREARSSLGKARDTSGTRASRTRRRGGGARAACAMRWPARHCGAALLWRCTFQTEQL
jgi:hypothetical protein